MKETLAFPVVCIIAEKSDTEGNPLILIQKRIKKKNNNGKVNLDYPGIWELPQGRIRSNETITDAARRELKEETGLDITEINSLHYIKSRKILDSSIESFFPLISTFDLEHRFIGLGIVVKTAGEFHNTCEASGHKWINEAAIKELIGKQEIFPLDCPIIEEYFKRKGKK